MDHINGRDINGQVESWDTDEHINDLTDWFSKMTHKQFRIIKKDKRESRNIATHLWSNDFQKQYIKMQ